jgi:hypothetical protein
MVGVSNICLLYSGPVLILRRNGCIFVLAQAGEFLLGFSPSLKPSIRTVFLFVMIEFANLILIYGCCGTVGGKGKS